MGKPSYVKKEKLSSIFHGKFCILYYFTLKTEQFWRIFLLQISQNPGRLVVSIGQEKLNKTIYIK